jgi:hypothetical protein
MILFYYIYKFKQTNIIYPFIPGIDREEDQNTLSCIEQDSLHVCSKNQNISYTTLISSNPRKDRRQAFEFINILVSLFLPSSTP